MYSTVSSGSKRTPAKKFQTLTTSSKVPKNLKIGVEPDDEVQIDVVRKQINPMNNNSIEYSDPEPSTKPQSPNCKRKVQKYYITPKTPYNDKHLESTTKGSRIAT